MPADNRSISFYIVTRFRSLLWIGHLFLGTLNVVYEWATLADDAKFRRIMKSC